MGLFLVTRFGIFLYAALTPCFAQLYSGGSMEMYHVQEHGTEDNFMVLHFNCVILLL